MPLTGQKTEIAPCGSICELPSQIITMIPTKCDISCARAQIKKGIWLKSPFPFAAAVIFDLHIKGMRNKHIDKLLMDCNI